MLKFGGNTSYLGTSATTTESYFADSFLHIGQDNGLMEIWQPETSIRTSFMPWTAAFQATALRMGAGTILYGYVSSLYSLTAYARQYGATSYLYSLGGFYDGLLSSVFNATSNVSSLSELNALFASVYNAALSLTRLKELEGDVNSLVGVISQMLVNATFTQLLEFSVQVGHGFLDTGSTYEIWAVTLTPNIITQDPTYAASRYENYNFNSFASFNNVNYAASSDGIFALSGDTDNGTDIDASIMLGRDALKTDNVTRMFRAYLTGTSDSELQLRIINDDDGVVYTYQLRAAMGDKVQRERVKIGRGLKAHYWQAEVANQNGGDFNLRGVNFVPVILKRKIQ